jgi:hypothetical protein
VLREDFSGTGAVSRAWVQSGAHRRAIAIDSDPRPQKYGRKALAPALHSQVQWLTRDVRSGGLPGADLICALNFSYCVFHRRSELRDYLKGARRALRGRGCLLIDCFSGVETAGNTQMEVDFGDFGYVWEQKSFDPLTRRGLFYMHFQVAGEPRRRDRVFRYDWRLWTAPELSDLLAEVGFRHIDLFTQGDPETSLTIYLTAR